ncbi:nuclear distribution protein nude [Emericellopsis atlantica]|uniref:Nuclear distribution protein nude n=1 Tax=Emericellopsis atlantica TaxID=2614577 RepID=A0A9P7ZVB7_9HYPO|nr:nuclear distribution protein nude [Emericellopsis atlantica]KAG9259024.1 nuclear distribution protein nude [Emericellopsis atlantica]
MAEPPSSPPGEGATASDALSWYKSQYEQLEADLAEFRESSKELEAELEKDIERAEKQERILQEKAETLGYEVKEWKRKYKESKTEAASAQASLEKEITTLRDTNRSLQLKLRDIEVANDDYERQARNTTSSLEDIESKYNQAIERAVMMEDEIKIGEQEREKMRVEAQRLREEYSDLKIEAELLQDKIKKQESRHLSILSTDISVPESPTFDRSVEPSSPHSTASSPLVTTPPDSKSMSLADDLSEHDPPSPPMSDASAPLPKRGESDLAKTPASALRRTRIPSVEQTPKPKSAKIPGSRTVSSRPSTGNAPLRTPAHRSVTARANTTHKIPNSNSLNHIRSLTAQMQRLEARVQNARSKLPAPTYTPPRASPRSSVSGGPSVPSTVTIRSRKRTTGSAASSVAGDETTPTNPHLPQHTKSHVPRLSESRVSRLSYGPLPNRGPESDISRPSSRASMSSARPASRTEMAPPRPLSRSSLGGTRTPLGRPRSSMGGAYHGHSGSVSRMDEEEEDEDGEFRTPSRRGMYSKFDPRSSTSSIAGPTSSIPVPGARRQSGSRRTSQGAAIGRPSISKGQKLEDLGETY